MSEDLTFGPAVPQDAEAVLAFYRSLIGAEGCVWSMEYPDMEYVKKDIAEGNLYLLREEGGTIAATVSAGRDEEIDDPRVPWKLEIKKACGLARLGVAPQLHRQGLGERVLHEALSAAKARGFDGARMLVAKESWGAMVLYEKNGFENTGEVHLYDMDFYCYEMKF